MGPQTDLVRQAGTASDGVRVEDGPGGRTIAVRTPDGRWVRLHSSRDPLGEADRLVSELFVGGEPDFVIIIGLGLGYVLDAVEARSARTRVLALEPVPETLPALMQRRDWTNWLHKDRLTLVVGPDFGNSPAASKALGGKSAPVLAHPVIAREFPSATAQARGVAEKILSGAQSNAAARRVFAGRYLRNTLINLPTIAAEGDAGRLNDAARGVPTVIVAAGPSLDDNLDSLRRLRGRSLFISVDTALRPLLAAGIRPHIVVGIDPGEVNARHLTDLPPTDGIWLVGEGSLNPRAFRAFESRTFSFHVSNHHPWPWLAGHGLGRGSLRAWGSVLTSAFDLACGMGCDPIVFAGADLAYTQGLLYCRNTAFEAEWSHLATNEARAEEFREFLRKQGSAPETDVRGNPVLSRSHFVQFRDWIVSRAGELTCRKVFNGTGGGILHGGCIEQVDLAGLAFPETGDLDNRLRSRLATAWSDDAGARGEDRARLAEALGCAPDEGVPLDTWMAFAGETTPRAQIVSCVANAARKLVEAQPSGVRTQRLDAEPICRRSFDAVPQAARIMVVGGHHEARALKRRLVGSRADACVLGFADREPGGTLDRLPVYPFSRLEETDYDAIATASDVSAEDLSRAAAPGVPVIRFDSSLSSADKISPYVWLDEALPRIAIDKPVLLLGKGPGLAKVPPDAHRTHFVLSINQAFARVEHADAVFFLDADQLIHILFAPGFAGRWDRLFVPDGIMKRFDNVKDTDLPFGAQEFDAVERYYTDSWAWDQLMRFEDVDRVIDFSWIKNRVVRFNLQNVYWDRAVHPEWPHIDRELDAFRPESMAQPNLLKSGCNSAHLALSFLFKKGVTSVVTAGLGLEEGYATDIDARTAYKRQTDHETPRWFGTLKVMDHLGIRHQRVEEMCDAELARTFGR